MSDQGAFNTPEQEARLLAGEIGEVKEVLREVARKLSRIEGRAKRAFPSVFPKTQPRLKSGAGATPSPAPSMTIEQLMGVYDGVVQQARGGDLRGARARLEAMDVPDLNLLRTELGASIGKRKPSTRTFAPTSSGASTKPSRPCAAPTTGSTTNRSKR